MTPATERYLAVDSLRGIAALAVALFHLHSVSFEGVDSGLLRSLHAILQYGYLGVPIFFVISGFVIAATVKPPDVDLRYIGKFAVKRSARLDPPYWLSIALEIALIYVTLRLFHIEAKVPSYGQTAAHLFYAQNLLGFGDIAANYWTLCMEVQFYIFLALVFAFANRWQRGNASPQLARGIFALTGLWSLLIAAEIVGNPLQGLFLSHWYLFLLGATCYWSCVAHTIDRKVFLGYCALALIVFVLQLQKNHYVALNTLLAVLTALFLYTAVLRQKMSTWLTHRVLLYLGSISYSLYLFHAIIGDRFVAFIRRWLLPRLDLSLQSAAMALLLLATVLAVSIVAAHLVYRFVEKPSMRLSKRVKPASATSILNDVRARPAAIRPLGAEAAVRPIE